MGGSIAEMTRQAGPVGPNGSGRTAQAERVTSDGSKSGSSKAGGPTVAICRGVMSGGFLAGSRRPVEGFLKIARALMGAIT
ncbi:hypothetical protein ABZ851_21400 [Streptomyces sp. NPDC047049]|uniref:hypothetical protein n=1 Tax=Streptomyces sp. NPDC047049 TaxID=3156688 RepID=UPI0034020512